MKKKRLLHEAHDRAVEILERCATSQGFRGSCLDAGYRQVWARDSAITSIGAVVSGSDALLPTVRASLETLGQFQSDKGLVPLNVDPHNGHVSTENAGALDSNLWYVLLHYLYWLWGKDTDFLVASWGSIDKAVTWLTYQDMNDCGLIETPEAGNWMDLIAVRYNVLYDNVLYYAAVLAHELLYRQLPPETACCRPKADAAEILERINLLMWIDRCWVADHFAEHLERLKSIRLEWFMLYHNIGTISSRPFYLPWVAFREYGDWLDSLGNLLAILFGVADGHRREHILRYMYQVGVADPLPSKAIHPPIYPGESDWREYYRSRNLNLPHQYHNGGIWPFIGGFHVAAMVRHGWSAESEGLLLSLAKANMQGVERPWEFNEWLHGVSGKPMGFGQQAWSAAMYLFAEHAVQTGRLPLFDELAAAKPDAAVAAENNEFHLASGGGPSD